MIRPDLRPDGLRFLVCAASVLRFPPHSTRCQLAGETVTRSLAYREIGSRIDTLLPPVVIMHGLLGSGGNFQSWATRLSDDFANRRSFLLVDLRNHGDSPHSPTMSFREMAADVKSSVAAGNASAPRLNDLGPACGRSECSRWRAPTASVSALARHLEPFQAVLVLDTFSCLPSRVNSVEESARRAGHRARGGLWPLARGQGAYAPPPRYLVERALQRAGISHTTHSSDRLRSQVAMALAPR